MEMPFGGTDPQELAALQVAAARLREITGGVKRAVEGLAAQPRRAVMPWEDGTWPGEVS